MPCRDRILAAAAGHHSGKHFCVARQLWTSPYRRENGRRYFETILKSLQSLGKARDHEILKARGTHSKGKDGRDDTGRYGMEHIPECTSIQFIQYLYKLDPYISSMRGRRELTLTAAYLSMGPPFAFASPVRTILRLERFQPREGHILQNLHGRWLTSDPSLGGELTQHCHGLKRRYLPQGETVLCFLSARCFPGQSNFIWIEVGV